MTYMPIKKCLFIAFIALLNSVAAVAQTLPIKAFAVKENPFGVNQIAIVATDTAGVIQENVTGTYRFTINGFDEDLVFDSGTAFYHRKLDKSSFIYLKHQNDAGTNSTLYYVYKSDSKLTPIHISWVVLVLIPLILVLIAYMFRKFIIISVIIFCAFLYFSENNGLNFPSFFGTVFDGIKHLF